MKKNSFLLLACIALLFYNCNKASTVEQDSIKTTNTSTEEISDLSIYNLPSTWTTQEGRTMKLKELQGNVLVMVMIYTSCKAACPRFVADMRHIKEKVTGKSNG